MSDIYKDSTLEKRLASIIFKAQYSDLAPETALGISDGVDEVSIASKQRDTFDVAA